MKPGSPALAEIWDLKPAFRVDEADFIRLLGYPRRHEPGERPRELMAWARAWYAENGRPWIYRREVEARITEEGVSLDGAAFASPRLRDHFRAARVGRAVLVAVSAGAGAESHAQALWAADKPDEYFFLQSYAAAVVESLAAAASGRICEAAERHGTIAIPHYSPGYAGWEIAGQNRLFELIREGMSGSWPEAIEVLPSGMIRPTKSLLGVFGLTARTPAALESPRLVPCRSCSFSPCRFRRAPYR